MEKSFEFFLNVKNFIPKIKLLPSSNYIYQKTNPTPLQKNPKTTLKPKPKNPNQTNFFFISKTILFKSGLELDPILGMKYLKKKSSERGLSIFPFMSSLDVAE